MHFTMTCRTQESSAVRQPLQTPQGAGAGTGLLRGGMRMTVGRPSSKWGLVRTQSPRTDVCASVNTNPMVRGRVLVIALYSCWHRIPVRLLHGSISSGNGAARLAAVVCLS